MTEITLPSSLILVVILIFVSILIILTVLWSRTRSQLNSAAHNLKTASDEVDHLRTRFSPVLSIEEEVVRLQKEAAEISQNITNARTSYAEKRTMLGKLEEEVAVFDEKLSFAAFGVYEPHFDFGDSQQYKEKIKEIRTRQKQMVSSKTATIAPVTWHVDGSLSKGRVMMNRQSRLTLRAFNGECASAIANARWNNVVAMEKRILNAEKQINAANKSSSLVVNEGYVALKLDELHIAHEYREQLKIEKDRRAERARAEREEKKLLAEARAAEREERRYQKLLDKARKEAGTDKRRIEELEAALAEAHDTSERARSMAQMTKSGYVYVVSNIGSFGDDVVKIGLTRRVNPDDRVRELGDASVPFRFDTHAMVYSDDAPALEAALHQEFAVRRVNVANLRKEFFRVSLDDVEEAVRRLAPGADFFRDREAQEWHETLARRKQALDDMQSVTEKFPLEI